MSNKCTVRLTAAGPKLSSLKLDEVWGASLRSEVSAGRSDLVVGISAMLKPDPLSLVFVPLPYHTLARQQTEQYLGAAGRNIPSSIAQILPLHTAKKIRKERLERLAQLTGRCVLGQIGNHLLRGPLDPPLPVR